MAKDDPKKKGKDPKAKEEAPKEAPKDASKNDWKEQTKADGGAPSGGCSSFAKVLIYFIPLALYVPWAYRMFKGNACCPEVPKYPSVSMPQGCPSGTSSFSRLGNRLQAPKEQQSCEPNNEYREEQDYCDPRGQDRGKGKPINVDKEREECLDQSKQCLEKCMEKCFDADKAEKKRRKKKKDRRNECDEDEDE